jgi:hypothetical protein
MVLFIESSELSNKRYESSKSTALAAIREFFFA